MSSTFFEVGKVYQDPYGPGRFFVTAIVTEPETSTKFALGIWDSPTFSPRTTPSALDHSDFAELEEV